MATNPLIALQVRSPDIAGSFQRGRLQALQEQQADQQAQRQNRLLDLQEQQTRSATETANLQQQAARQKLGGQAVAGLALELDPLVKSGNITGAQQLVDSRFREFAQQGLSFPDPAPLRQALASGNTEVIGGLPQRLLNYSRTLGHIEREPAAPAGPASVQEYEYARRTGYGGTFEDWMRSQQRSIGALADPAGVREWGFYNKLSQEDQERYNAMKRGDKLSSTTEQNIISGTEAAQQAEMKFINYSDLAKRYEDSRGLMPSGVTGRLSEWIKEQTGSQDEFSMLRRDWAAVRASEVVNNLPPGAASDADIAMAMSGFPTDQANPQQIASFLRGVAKMARLNGEYQSFKADYLSQNRSPAGLNQAWRAQASQRSATTSSANQPPPSAGQGDQAPSPAPAPAVTSVPARAPFQAGRFTVEAVD